MLADERVAEARDHAAGRERRGLAALPARVEDLAGVPVDARVVHRHGVAVADLVAVALDEHREL